MTKYKVSIMWFRRDLRLQDNHALYQALIESETVIPVFVFDITILSKLEDKADARINFIHQQIVVLNKMLRKQGASILAIHGDPIVEIQRIVQKYDVQAVFCNEDYEPYAIKRDETIAAKLAISNVRFMQYKDQVIFQKKEIVKNDQKPYSVFTPYKNAWLKKYASTDIKTFPSEELLSFKLKRFNMDVPSLSSMGFHVNNSIIPEWHIEKGIISKYDQTRDLPYLEKGTSRLGIHLRFGTISIRNLVLHAVRLNETFLSELIWREFYMMILWHYPHVENGNFNKRYDPVEWRNNEMEFMRWQEGKTGYSFVDAGMRQLNETGYMHNRLRMITASFLCKHLLIDWRWGEAYFAVKLLDYELSSNNGGWQWAAGTGCDAVPYFRVFNPELQQKRFDPNMEYTRKWVPELNTSQYPAPIVEHSYARDRAINTFKIA